MNQQPKQPALFIGIDWADLLDSAKNGNRWVALATGNIDEPTIGAGTYSRDRVSP